MNPAVQSDLMVLDTAVNSVIENNSDYVVEYLAPPTRFVIFLDILLIKQD